MHPGWTTIVPDARTCSPRNPGSPSTALAGPFYEGNTRGFIASPRTAPNIGPG